MFPCLYKEMTRFPLGGDRWIAGVLTALLLVFPATLAAQSNPGIELLPDSLIIEDGVEIEGERVIIKVDGEEDHNIEISIGSSNAEEIVKFGQDITINEGEFIEGDVVALGGTIYNFGRIAGDCVAIGGRVVLGDNAIVEGDVVSMAGALELGENSRIGGDAVALWGDFERATSTEIEGEIIQKTRWSGIPMFQLGFGDGILYDAWGLFRHIVWILVLLILSIILFKIFPSRMERLAVTVSNSGGKAFFAGLAGWLLWLPLFIALCITIVGALVAVVQIFITPVLILFGYAAVAKSTGSSIGRNFGSKLMDRKAAILIGLLVLEGAVVVGHLFGVLGSMMTMVSGVLTLIGYLVIAIATTIGFGAILMTRFRPLEQIHQEAQLEG
ncbi:MAG: hypothetical protein HKN21_05685 [Candidatus Eisenbacteria bacterium]|uniref:Polymer-forming cytoskeletal protein n=1 Tax=Eiseniibacteriota bacterium TaxID=2212470 RepID=A0A7Y2H1R2_UNCEI|nr:hypothetical protein [Candidatus Eisenbacteria bacterium]